MGRTREVQVVYEGFPVFGNLIMGNNTIPRRGVVLAALVAVELPTSSSETLTGPPSWHLNEFHSLNLISNILSFHYMISHFPHFLSQKLYWIGVFMDSIVWDGIPFHCLLHQFIFVQIINFFNMFQTLLKKNNNKRLINQT